MPIPLSIPTNFPNYGPVAAPRASPTGSPSPMPVMAIMAQPVLPGLLGCRGRLSEPRNALGLFQNNPGAIGRHGAGRFALVQDPRV